MTRTHNPPTRGALHGDVLPALGMSVTDAAAELGVSRLALSRILNGRTAVLPERALRLECWLGADHGGRADMGLHVQAA